MAKILYRLRKFRRSLGLAAAVFAGSAVVAGSAFAAEPTTSSALSLNFDMTQMFSWAQMIINVLTPVLYITLGVSLGFIIIRALKSAFAG